MNDFFGPILLHVIHESTSIYRHDKKNSYNNAKDLTNPERGRKLNVKAASFLSNSPHCAWILQGAPAREEPYACDTVLCPWAALGEGGQEAIQHNPYSIFIPFVSVFIFVFFLAE